MQKLKSNLSDENFLSYIKKFENIVAKVLSIALLIIIVFSLIDLFLVLFQDLLKTPVGFISFAEKSILEVFGLFLNVLIALELLENITAYLRKHIVQVELVIVTSLIAVARKIIIFDLSKYNNLDLVALACGILALAVSYWLIRQSNKKVG